MEIRLKLPLVGTAITFLVAITVSIGVIPQVALDPLATPESAVPAFWANVIANLFVGLLMGVAPYLKGSRAHALLLRFAGIGALILGLILLDAASAFREHDPAMQGISVALFGCVGADLIAGLLAFIGARPVARQKGYTV